MSDNHFPMLGSRSPRPGNHFPTSASQVRRHELQVRRLECRLRSHVLRVRKPGFRARRFGCRIRWLEDQIQCHAGRIPAFEPGMERRGNGFAVRIINRHLSIIKMSGDYNRRDWRAMEKCQWFYRRVSCKSLEQSNKSNQNTVCGAIRRNTSRALRWGGLLRRSGAAAGGKEQNGKS